jgi:hypothetical protein
MEAELPRGVSVFCPVVRGNVEIHSFIGEHSDQVDIIDGLLKHDIYPALPIDLYDIKFYPIAEL